MRGLRDIKRIEREDFERRAAPSPQLTARIGPAEPAFKPSRRDALGDFQAATKRHAEATAALNAATAALVATAQHKVGDSITSSQGGPMVITHVTVREYADGCLQFSYSGMKLKQDGTPHATATAYAFGKD